MILAPDEVLVDDHIVARDYPARVDQPQLGRGIVHAGLPIRFVGTPGSVHPAPTPAQHQWLLQSLLVPSLERHDP
jgi:hypothetical protein